VLRASHALLRPGGRTAFYTIFIPAGLSDSAYRRAGRIGPNGVTSRRTPRSLVEAAGFDLIDETDVSAEFLRVVQGLLRVSDRDADELLAEMSANDFETLQRERAQLAAAIQSGILRRSLVSGVRRG
jgi:hypothetical protein